MILGIPNEFSKEAEAFLKSTLEAEPFEIYVNDFDDLANMFSVSVIIHECTELLSLMENAKLIDNNNAISLVDSGVDLDIDDINNVIVGGDGHEGVWDPMKKDFVSRKNTLENADTDPEVALMGRSNMEDYCSKYLLYGKCPR
jgi:hypothetical protein